MIRILSISFICIPHFFISFQCFLRLRGHQTIQFQCLIELVLKWNDCCSIEEKSFTFPGIRHVRQLIWGNIQLFCKDLSVTCSLVQHQDKITVLKDIFNLPAGKKIFDILCDTSRYASPFSESLPDFYVISCCLFFFEQKVELIDSLRS